MVKNQRGKVGILHDLQQEIQHYTEFKVYLRITDEGYDVRLDNPAEEHLGSEELPGVIISKNDDELFNATVEFLQNILKENAA